MMAAAATKMSDPSTADDMYSALPCPKSWLWSAGFADRASAHSATTAATRLTVDSSASDRSPTEPVRYAATPLMTTVATAANTDTHMKRMRKRAETGSAAMVVLTGGPLDAPAREGGQGVHPQG